MDLFDFLPLGDVMWARVFWQWILPVSGVVAAVVMAVMGSPWWWVPLVLAIVLWLLVRFVFEE